MKNARAELARLRLTLAALDRGVRAAAPLMPYELVARWADFHGRSDRLLAHLERVGAAEILAGVATLAGHVARWASTLAAHGVQVEPTAASVGFDGFITPGRARARMDSVEAEVNNLDHHIRAHKDELGRDFYAGWERWRDSWRQFYARYPREWDWWYLGNASAWNETLVFQARLAQFAEAVQRAGVRSPLPLPHAPAERDGSDWLGDVRSIAIAGAVGVGVLGAVYLAQRLT